MSWNDNLYLYSLARGGVYYGQEEDEWNGTLLLERGQVSVVVRCDVETSGRWQSHTARALALADLEQPYALTISPRGAWRQGMNAVLGGLDKLSGKGELYRDYGAPEVTDGRTIRSSAPAFTQAVFRDLEFRAALLAQTGHGVAVGPCGTGARSHLVEARAELENRACGWDIRTEDFCDWEARGPGTRKMVAGDNFEEKLDQLIDLALAARRAVMAWRM